MFADRVAEHLARSAFDALFANYWLSPEAGHQLKHRFCLKIVKHMEKSVLHFHTMQLGFQALLYQKLLLQNLFFGEIKH